MRKQPVQRKAEVEARETGPSPGGGPKPGSRSCRWLPGEMARQDRARWLPAALLLLWVPGCLAVSGPDHVWGTVGGSLTVHCQYEEEFRGHKKYWCESPSLRVLKNKIVETTGSDREVRNGRVSIRDHPANLTFTVTMERLTERDQGKYWCGINVPWSDFHADPTFEVEVIVSPAPLPPSRTTARTSITTTATTTTTAHITTVSTVKTTVKTTVKATHGPNGLDDSPRSLGLPVLLSLLGLLLFLLAGASLLAWRMVRRRIKAGKSPEPPQKPSGATQESEPCYANLELQTRSLLEVPVQQEEVEYSTVQAPREDPQYTTVVFNSQNQDLRDNRAPQPEPEYSVIKRT